MKRVEIYSNTAILTHFAVFVAGYAVRWLLELEGKLKKKKNAEVHGPQLNSLGVGRRSKAPKEELKMVLVVNQELKMGKGKTGEIS
jgi:hypothetical protein